MPLQLCHTLCVFPPQLQRVVFEDPTFQQWVEELACMACGGGDNEDQLLLCDGKWLYRHCMMQLKWHSWAGYLPQWGCVK
jgi:hypothetical protein